MGGIMDLHSWQNFIREIDKLKSVERRTLTFHERRHENSAEHSWHLAMAVLAYHSAFPKQNFDLLKALKMALLHDVVEIDAGDTFIYSDLSRKAELETAAAHRIFGLLPEGKAEMLALWEEFEEKKSQEARLVSALDRFLPIYSNCLNGGHSWKQHGVKYSQVIERNKDPISSVSAELWSFTESLLNEAVARGDLSK